MFLSSQYKIYTENTVNQDANSLYYVRDGEFITNFVTLTDFTCKLTSLQNFLRKKLLISKFIILTYFAIK